MWKEELFKDVKHANSRQWKGVKRALAQAKAITTRRLIVKRPTARRDRRGIGNG